MVSLGGGSTSGKEFGVVWRWGFPLQCLAGCVYTEPGAMVCSQQIFQMVEPLWRVVLVWELIIKLFSQAVRSVVAVGSVGSSPVIPTQTSSVVLDRGSDLAACWALVCYFWLGVKHLERCFLVNFDCDLLGYLYCLYFRSYLVWKTLLKQSLFVLPVLNTCLSYCFLMLIKCWCNFLLCKSSVKCWSCSL